MNTMPDFGALSGMTEQQLATALSLGTPFLESVANAFGQQAAFLQRLEALTVEALERRRAGCTAMQELIERLRAARSPSDVTAAQQEWLAGAMQRLMADATCCQTAGLGLLSEMGRQWPRPEMLTALPATARPARTTR